MASQQRVAQPISVGVSSGKSQIGLNIFSTHEALTSPSNIHMNFTLYNEEDFLYTPENQLDHSRPLMSTPNVQRLTSMTDAQIKEVADLCDRAYRGDVCMEALVGGDWSIQNQFIQAMTRATLLDGEVFAVLGDGGKILAVAFWFAPGHGLFSKDDQRALGFNKFFRELSPEAQFWWQKAYPERMAEMKRKYWSSNEVSRLWWCANLATDPSFQRRGFASALIKAKHQEAHRKNQILGLAAAPERVVGFYLGAGFKEKGRGDFTSPTGSNFLLRMFVKE